MSTTHRTTDGIRDIAERYTRAGFSVLPIGTDGDKAPAWGRLPKDTETQKRVWKPFQTRIANEDELTELFGSNGDSVGVGIIGGKVSGNLEIIDIDAPELVEAFMRDVELLAPGLLARLPIIETPRGDGACHIYYRGATEVPGNEKLASSEPRLQFDKRSGEPVVDANTGEQRIASDTLIETRGESGYVVAPGSPAACHSTGRQYRQVSGPPITETPTITPDERNTLLRVAKSFDERQQEQQQNFAKVTARKERAGLCPGDDFAARTAWSEILTPHSWTQVSEHYWRRPGKTIGVSASTKMTSKQGNELLRVFSSNAHPFESDVSYGKFAAYTTLNHDGDFAAAASALGSLGYGDRIVQRQALRISGLAGRGNGVQEPTAFVAQHPKIVFERITASQLDSGDYQIEYLIDGTMTAGQPMIVAGPKKALKTNILLDLGISLATGGLFLGRLKINRAARVGIMSGESGMATIQETCRRICKSKDLALKNIEGLIFSSDLPRLDDVRFLVALEEFVTQDEIEVLILDPAYLMMPGGDAGNLFIQGEMLRALSTLCEQLGVTMVLCHHTKKGVVDPYSPPELEDIAWAGFQEFARQWLLIGRREKYEPGTGKHALWLNIGGSAGHSALWGVNINEGVYRGPGTRVWDVEVLTAEAARDEAARQREGDKQATKDGKRRAAVAACREAILKAFIGLPDGATKRTLQDRAGHKGTNLDEAIAELLRIGELVEAEITRGNNQTYPGFKRVYPS